MYTKKALRFDRNDKSDDGIPCAYVICECGHKVNLPVVSGLPINGYECLCGIVYNSGGWIIERPTIIQRGDLRTILGGGQ